jgi:iron complex outermembrane receptor protein
VKHQVPSGVWSTLRIKFEGNLFSVYFDGTKLFEVEDETFKGAGKVGLWTKADSVTYFDDFTVEELSGGVSSASPGKILAQKLVDELAAKHPELVRIGLHLTPPTGSENLIVASNVASKVGQKSDPEDLAAMRAGKPVALREQGNFDVTLPLHDASGKVIGAIGLTFKPTPNEQEAAAIQRAQSIARELEKQISSKAKLFDVAG